MLQILQRFLSETQLGKSIAYGHHMGLLTIYAHHFIALRLTKDIGAQQQQVVNMFQRPPSAAIVCSIEQDFASYGKVSESTSWGT